MSETSNIAEMAAKVARDLFEPFKWERVGPADENFKCDKAAKHGKSNRQHPQHPCDAVFKYFDPYLGKNIYLLTDFKSYAKETISYTAVRDALNSLGACIECARTSKEWQDRYVLDGQSFEVRGFLYIYNHDNRYDKDLLSNIESKIKLEKLNLAENQQIHLLAPSSIIYLRSVVQDMSNLYQQGEFPRSNYSFFYPDMKQHKASGNPDEHPGIVEALCGPFMVAKFTNFIDRDDNGGEKVVGDGCVVYYSMAGETDYEFMYLLDYLSTWQLLAGKGSIKIRIVHSNPSSKLRSNFERAKKLYLRMWGEDESRKFHLDRIELEVVNITLPNYVPEIVGWRYHEK